MNRKTADQIIAEIAEVLAEARGEHIVNIANQVLSKEITYINADGGYFLVTGRNNMQTATYVSVWDNSHEVRTKCIVDLSEMRVLDIETSDENVDGTCTRDTGS